VWRKKGEIAEAAAAKRGQGCQELPWFWKLEFEMNLPLDQL
jgi:hypothetical protein